jgi:hypothetical protein
MIGCAPSEPSRAFPSKQIWTLHAARRRVKGERSVNPGGLTETYFPETHPQVTGQTVPAEYGKKVLTGL